MPRQRTHCLICRSAGATPFHLEEGYKYYSCDRCGFVFLDPMPTPEELAEIYRQETGATFHHAAEIAGAYEKRLEARLRFRVVKESLEEVSRQAFEIGCGAGYFLESLASAGWKAAGCELAPAYVAHARGRGLEVLQGDVRSAPAGPYGAVFLFNVLSHLYDPSGDFVEIRDRLERGGALVLETGNAAEVEPRRVGHFGAPEHVFHFGERHVRALLARAGFDRIRVRRFNVEWQRKVLSWRHLIRRARGTSGTPRSGVVASVSETPGRLGRELASRFLLALRYNAGRVLADKKHYCTLLVTARKT